MDRAPTLPSGRMTGRSTVRPNPQMAVWGGIDDRRADVDGEHAHIGDRAGAAALLVRTEGLGLCSGGEIPDLPADLGHAEQIHVLHDRDHQAVLGAHRHGEVDVLVGVKRLAVKRGVGVGVLGQNLAQHLAEQVVHGDLAAEDLLIAHQLFAQMP